MTSKQIRCAFLVASTVLAACSSRTEPASLTTPSGTPAPAVKPAEPTAPGGYAEDPDAKPAADEAIKLLQAKENDPSISLVAIRKAEKQIVAGTNYRLELDLNTAKGPKTAKVVVYQPLRGPSELTSVEGL